MDDQITEFLVIIDALVDVGTDGALQDVREGEVVVVDAQVGHDTDDDVGTHLAGQVGREVVLGAAVNQHIGFHPHGGEHAWHSHTRTDGSGQGAMVEHYLAVGDQVGGYTAKGARQRLEVDVVTLAQVLAQGVLDVGAAYQASSQRVLAVVEEDAVVQQVDVLALSLVKGLVSHRQSVAQHVAPVDAVDKCFDVGRIISHGIQAADDGTH